MSDIIINDCYSIFPMNTTLFHIFARNILEINQNFKEQYRTKSNKLT